MPSNKQQRKQHHRLCGRLPVVTLVLVTLLAASGCSQEAPEPIQEITQSAGYLPRLKMSKNADLTSMLDELSAARALPEDLRRQPIPREANCGPSLEALIPVDARKPLFDETIAFFPQESLTFSTVDWERALRFLEKHDSSRLSARQVIAGKDCDLRIEPTQALTADLSIVYAMHAIARMEAISARLKLDEGDLTAGVKCVEAMFAIASCLDQQLHISCRLQAVHIRSDALLVMQEISQHENVTSDVLVAARHAIDRAIAHWPDEREAWQSDRALGLICYEYAQAGDLESVLSPDELQAMDAETQSAVYRFRNEAADADAVSYLQAMQEVIDECDKPLFRRKAIALQLPDAEQFPADMNVGQFSLAEILIASIPQGQALFALDRARIEAWQIGLARALSEPAPAFRNSPLSGQPYTVIDRDETIAVWGVGATPRNWERPVVIRKP